MSTSSCPNYGLLLTVTVDGFWLRDYGGGVLVGPRLAHVHATPAACIIEPLTNLTLQIIRPSG